MENIIVKRKKYEVVSEIIKKDDHVSYQCKMNGRIYFVKKYNSLNDFDFEIKNYKDFKNYGIRNPKLLKKDKKELTIVYEYIDGISALDAIANDTIDDYWFEQLFLIYKFARFSRIDINYLPEYYKMFNGELCYMNHYYFLQDPKKNLENYGIDFWLYGDKCVEHLKKFGYQIDKKRIVSKTELNKKIVLLSIMKW